MGGCATLAYAARLVTVGNGTIQVLGYAINPFGYLLIILLMLAIPETIEMLPFGPTKK